MISFRWFSLKIVFISGRVIDKRGNGHSWNWLPRKKWISILDIGRHFNRNGAKESSIPFTRGAQLKLESPDASEILVNIALATDNVLFLFLVSECAVGFHVHVLRPPSRTGHSRNWRYDNFRKSFFSVHSFALQNVKLPMQALKSNYFPFHRVSVHEPLLASMADSYAIHSSAHGQLRYPSWKQFPHSLR